MKNTLPLFALTLASSAFAQTLIFKEVPARAGILNPAKETFSDGLVGRLKPAAGYKVSLFAKGMMGPRLMVQLKDGTVLVTSNSGGTITGIKNGEAKVALDGKPGVHGIALMGDEILFATITEVYASRMGEDGRLKDVRRLTANLPQGGQHPKRTLAIGPDGMIYIGVGSRTNDNPAPQPEDACVMRMKPDGSGLEVYAKGLRNSMALAFHPVTGALWGWDQGSDLRGNDRPYEELNEIKEGKHYGWPWVYGKRELDPYKYDIPKGFQSMSEFAATTEPAVLTYQAHSSPIWTIFSPKGDEMMVTMRGSWNRDPATGYKVVCVPFDASGRPGRPVDLLTGFLSKNGKSYLGRPAGLLMLADGSILVTDDSNGAIYRLTKG